MKTLKISALYINLRNWNKQLHVFYSIVLFIIVVIKKSYIFIVVGKGEIYMKVMLKRFSIIIVDYYRSYS